MEDQDPGSDEGTDFLLAEEAAAKGGHPAWQEILDAIPEQYRESVMPTLEKWDKGVQNRFQSLHSKYEPLKQYAEYDPEDLQVALNLKQAIEADPRAVWDLMAQTYEFSLEQGATDGESEMGMFGEDGEEFEGAVDPALYQQLEMTQQQLQELQQQQYELQQQREMQAAEEELDAYMEYLHNTHGDFDDDYVITLLANGVDGEEAVNRYNAIVTKAAGTAKPPAPKVMGASGGVPSRAIDPNALSNSETKDLVAQMLLQAQQGD